MTPIHLTNEGKKDPVFGTCPETFDVFEWHGEIFDLPKDCVPLAGSEIAPLQAFRYGSRAYGLLFHLEMEENRDRIVVPRVCTGSHEGTFDGPSSKSRRPSPSPATPSGRRSAGCPSSRFCTLITASLLK